MKAASWEKGKDMEEFADHRLLRAQRKDVAGGKGAGSKAGILSV